VWEEDRFKNYKDKGFPLISWGIDGGLIGPKVAPGTFTVRLSVDGKDLTQMVVVKKDPNNPNSDAEIRAQLKMSLELRDQINSTVESINKLEWVREQLQDLRDMLADNKGAAALRSAAADLDKRLVTIEEDFFSQVLAEGDSKSFRAPVKLYSELSVLAGDVMQGDFPPTNAMAEVQEELRKTGPSRPASSTPRWPKMWRRSTRRSRRRTFNRSTPECSDALVKC
jgi:hypothetical protein